VNFEILTPAFKENQFKKTFFHIELERIPLKAFMQCLKCWYQYLQIWISWEDVSVLQKCGSKRDTTLCTT